MSHRGEISNKKYFYVEHDGRVFLVGKSGLTSFPTSRDEIPFRIRVIRKLAFSDCDVYYCKPQTKRHPDEWALKDDILLEDGIDRIVRRAICYSYVRHVCHGIVEKTGRVMMVKASRGYTKNHWNLPGGFINYGETPEMAVEREIMEETGLKVKAGRLIGVYTGTFMDGFYMISFVYLCNPISGKLKPSEGEIGEIAYMPPREAIRRTNSPFVKDGLRALIKNRPSSL